MTKNYYYGVVYFPLKYLLRTAISNCQIPLPDGVVILIAGVLTTKTVNRRARYISKPPELTRRFSKELKNIPTYTHSYLRLPSVGNNA